MKKMLLLLWLLSTATWAVGAWWEAYLPPYEKENLQKNRDWIARRGPLGAAGARVGVFADAGVWNLGAVSLVKSLEDSGIPCRVLDRDSIGAIARLEVLVLPGGLSTHQYSALGPVGAGQIKAFVEGGGRCLAICAGAYLVSRTVRYQGVPYPYPIGLFDGDAEGPVAGLPDYPAYGPVQLQVTPAGAARGLNASHPFLYGGGPRFTGGSDVSVLLLYPDGTAAAVRRAVGKGEVIACGAHPELMPPEDGPLEASPPPWTGPMLRALLGL